MRDCNSKWWYFSYVHYFKQEEIEPFPEERENFLQQLYKFMEDRGKLFNLWLVEAEDRYVA